jgi:dephospho-CoA kinase
VAADESTQVERAMKRDNLGEDEVRARLKAQLPLSAKIAAADYVVENNGDLASLGTRADEVLDAICAKAGVDPARYPKRA